MAVFASVESWEHVEKDQRWSNWSGAQTAFGIGEHIENHCWQSKEPGTKFYLPALETVISCS